MGRTIATALLALGLGLGIGPAKAETAFELVFRGGTLNDFDAGSTLEYLGTDSFGSTAEGAEERIVVTLPEPDRVTIARSAAEGDEPGRVLGQFDAAVGNPLAMFFFERTVRSISGETGGSPYYIRNRMREALGEPGNMSEVTVPWNGAEVAATEITLQPFENDARRAELGPFADLEIRVTVSEDVPGWYHSLSASTPATEAGPGYRAELDLAEVEP